MDSSTKNPGSLAYAGDSTPLKMNMSSQKGLSQKERLVFQPPFFMGYSLVFRGILSFLGICQKITHHDGKDL